MRLDMCVFARILNSFRVTKSEALEVDDRCLSNANWIVGWRVSCVYRKSKKSSNLNADLRGGFLCGLYVTTLPGECFLNLSFLLSTRTCLTRPFSAGYEHSF